MGSPCRHTPEIKLAEMRRHLSLAPMSLWTGKDGRAGSKQPIVFFSQELDEWVDGSLLHVTQRQTNSVRIQDTHIREKIW